MRESERHIQVRVFASRPGATVAARRIKASDRQPLGAMIGDLHLVTFKNALSGKEQGCHVVEPGRWEGGDNKTERKPRTTGDSTTDLNISSSTGNCEWAHLSHGLPPFAAEVRPEMKVEDVLHQLEVVPVARSGYLLSLGRRCSFRGCLPMFHRVGSAVRREGAWEGNPGNYSDNQVKESTRSLATGATSS